MNKRKIVVLVLGFCFLTAAQVFGQSLFDIVLTGTVNEVQQAIENGAEINARTIIDRTALMIAAEYQDNPEIISALVQAGAEINARDKDGLTALMIATSFNQTPGSSAIVRALLDAGAQF